MSEKEILLLNSEEVAKTIQRNLNSIWESKFIKYIQQCVKENKNYSYNQTNSLLSAYVNMENTMEYLAKSFNLVILVDTYIQSGKYKGLPRRFKVVVRKNDSQKHETVLSRLRKEYDLDLFALVRNGYTNVKMVRDAYCSKYKKGKVYILTSPKTRKEVKVKIHSIVVSGYKQCYNFEAVDSELKFAISEDKLRDFNIRTLEVDRDRKDAIRQLELFIGEE